jgi:hypothetical protein
VVRGELGLEREDAISGCLGLGHPGQLEHLLHVRAEGGAGGLEVVEAVVALVRQRQSALDEERHVALRVARVGLDVEVDQRGDAVTLELARGAQEAGDVGDGVHAGQDVRQRCRPELLDALGVHEAGVEIADLAGLGAGLGIRGLHHDRVDVLLGLFGDQVERTPPRLVVRDVGAVQPRAVDVAEKIVLRADLGAQLLERETGAGGVGHAFQDMRPPESSRPGS